MNNLQRLRARREYFVTLNRGEEIDPAKVIRRFSYDHPVYTTEGVAAQARHAEISGARRTHYCGAYWGWGFHEDGVVSALRACDGARGGRARRGASARAGAIAAEPDAPRSGRGGAGRVSASAVYEGRVRHRRFEPVEHAFRYRSSSCTWTSPSCPRCSTPTRSSRPAAAPPPASAAPTSWATRRGRWTSAPATRSRPPPARRPAGPVRLLTGLRYLGHSFNPVSFYYCFDATGERVEAVVAEVENIPWGERHRLRLGTGRARGYGARATSSRRASTSPR